MVFTNILILVQENMRALLNVAAEQPDTEMLLQKHFTCLLSSIWRTSTRSTNNQKLSLNSPIFNRQVMGSANHTQELARKPFQGMKITSLSSKLVEFALQDSSTSQPLDTASRPRLQEPINKVGLDLTLEFPHGNDDSSTHFPPIIKLTIDGSDSFNYVNDPPGEDKLKVSRIAAEDRYRFVTLSMPKALHKVLRVVVVTKVSVVLFVGMMQIRVFKIRLDGLQTRSPHMIRSREVE